MKKSITTRLLATVFSPSQIKPVTGASALFLGRSNSGKSTLLNALLKQNLARVSKTPGKTQSLNYYQWGKLTLIDAPGYGYARRSFSERESWQGLMRAFFEQGPTRFLALLLLDAKRLPEDEEYRLIQSLQERALGVILLLTKYDRLNQSQRETQRQLLSRALQTTWVQENPLTWQPISAKTGEGMEMLRRRLFDYAKEF